MSYHKLPKRKLLRLGENQTDERDRTADDHVRGKPKQDFLLSVTRQHRSAASDQKMESCISFVLCFTPILGLNDNLIPLPHQNDLAI
jgi:hypothetical protein